MRIESLWDTRKFTTCLIVGTGPSHRLMPPELATCFDWSIGLNQAWKHFSCTYNLTIHPDLIPVASDCPPKHSWITKRKGQAGTWSSKLKLDDPHCWVFENNKDPHDFSFCKYRTKDKLYCGRGIQATAITLAAHMGAAIVVLAGIDMCSLGDDHHGHEQHVRFHGLEPAEAYAEYYENTAIVRQIVWETFGTEVLTLSPFLGLKNAEGDYKRLCDERSLGVLATPEDTSGYQRDGRDF